MNDMNSEAENFSKLDESQKMVVTANGGYHLVLAPPGCGKTHTLGSPDKPRGKFLLFYRKFIPLCHE